MSTNRILRTLALIGASLLGGCASTTVLVKVPELNKLPENRDATYRVDIPPAGHGSGVVIADDGYILTCEHVIAGEKRVEILINAGGGKWVAYEAKVVARDGKADMAVIKIDYRFRRHVVLDDAADAETGAAIYNVGYPYDFGEAVGRGNIMKIRYTDDLQMPNGVKLRVEDVTLAYVPDGPGTSGSGVFSERTGKLVGLMRISLFTQERREPPLAVKVVVPARTIRAFLDRNRIPYSVQAEARSGNAPSDERQAIIIRPPEEVPTKSVLPARFGR